MKKILALVELLRPLEWSKQLGNMVLGAFLAVYIAGSGTFQASRFDLWLFIAGFIAVGPLLWGGLYALNDYTDWKKDALHHVKKQRAIPSGRVAPSTALVFALACIALAFIVGILFGNKWFVLCLVAMFVNQLLYTIKPFNFKKLPVLDLVSGSLVNPFFRFYAGWLLFLPSFNAPWQMVVFVLGVQYAGYALYRLSGKEHEKSLGYKSSIVVFGERNIKLSAYAALLVGGLAFIYACFTVLPLKFLLLVIGSALLAPLYLQALSDPKRMDMKRMHSTIYVHYLLFIAGFVVLFFV